jgi:hypothetical protein
MAKATNGTVEVTGKAPLARSGPGIVCVSDAAGWCGFVHASVEEAVLCNHERTIRDARLDALFFRGRGDVLGTQTIVAYDQSSYPALRRAYEEGFTAPRDLHDDTAEAAALREHLGPTVFMRLAEAAAEAELAGDPDPLEDLHAESRAAYEALASTMRQAPPRSRKPSAKSARRAA